MAQSGGESCNRSSREGEASSAIIPPVCPFGLSSCLFSFWLWLLWLWLWLWYPGVVVLWWAMLVRSLKPFRPVGGYLLCICTPSDVARLLALPPPLPIVGSWNLTLWLLWGEGWASSPKYPSSLSSSRSKSSNPSKKACPKLGDSNPTTFNKEMRMGIMATGKTYLRNVSWLHHWGCVEHFPILLSNEPHVHWLHYRVPPANT